MIIDLNKCESIKDIKMDLTNLIPGLYFLFNVDDKTSRYKKIGKEYVPDINGNYVMDKGIDILNKSHRVLKYIGQGNTIYKRLIDHYRHDEKTVDVKKKGADKQGVGPVFTHIRIIKGFIRLDYDTVRIHHETLLVRKYLPELNNSSKLTENNIIIILNSAGKVSPYDLMVPYNIHARDIFRAYQAWLTEDMEYINNELVPYKMENWAGVIHPNRRDPRLYRLNGVKLGFSKWFATAVLRFHKKQKEAYVLFCKQLHNFIKLYDTDRYEDTLERNRINKKNKTKNQREYDRFVSKMYRQKLKNNKQPELL